jgi:diguanylate cyclase (GGDEF)-like protein
MYSKSLLLSFIRLFFNTIGLKKANNQSFPFDNVKKHVTYRYGVAMLLFFVVALICNALLYRSISLQHDNAEIINIAGEQRMLMQRISTLATIIHFSETKAKKNHSMTLLKKSLIKMEDQLLKLSIFVKTINNSNQQNSILYALYFNEPVKLHEQMLEFHKLVYQFTHTEGVDKKIMRQIVNQAIGPLLYEVDLAVNLYQIHAEQELAFTKKALKANTIFVLILLLAQIVFIFRPLARKLAEQASDLDKKATTDNLTGLLNRQSFEPRFSLIIKNAHSRGDSASLITIDLDWFKEVNHTDGHAAGDEVLREIGKRFSTLISPTLQVTRLGGDEFAIIIAHSLCSDWSLKYAEKIRQMIVEPIKYKGRLLRVTATVGMASYPNDALNIKKLLLAANFSLRLAKQKGRGSIQAFMPEQRHAIERDKIIIKSIEQREHLDGLFMEFQPLIDLKTQLITGCEALVRWDHPELGRISPDQFLKLAVSHGHGAFIGEIIRRRAMEGFKAIRTAGLKVPSLSLNLMDVELKSLSGPSKLIDQLNVFGLSPKDIEIEVTEDVVLGHLGNELERQLLELRSAGFRLALDDFGTGFATLEHLVKLEVDVIKLDRTFVAKIKKDDRSFKIINAIIKLAHGLSARVVAEGIETDEQLEILKTLSCDIGQGFLLARPMPVKELLVWHRNYTKSIACKVLEFTR